MVQRLMLRDALGLGAKPRLAAVGAGGKTTFLMQLAKEYAPNVILTCSTHLAVGQAAQADVHLILRSPHEIKAVFQRGIHDFTIITGDEVADGRLSGLPVDWLELIAKLADEANLPVLVEADGSRQLPIKAPAAHEPAIPSWVNEVVVSVGLSGIGAAITNDFVHRPEILANLTGQKPGDEINSKSITEIFLHPEGGLKNIPPGARKIALLNQADNEILAAAGGHIARDLLAVYDVILITRLQESTAPVRAVYAPTAGIILAAGKSQRLEGGQKVLLDWYGEPFVRKIARTAISAHLDPVVVVTGSQSTEVRQALEGLPVVIVENKNWESGQSTSIQTGISALPDRIRTVLFLLADQPQLRPTLLNSLIEEHRQTISPIIAPLVEDRRANPVLFDRATFRHFQDLRGDTGGRAIFSKFQVNYLPWLDRLMLMDVDTHDDYLRLLSNFRN